MIFCNCIRSPRTESSRIAKSGERIVTGADLGADGGSGLVPAWQGKNSQRWEATREGVISQRRGAWQSGLSKELRNKKSEDIVAREWDTKF